MKILYDHQIFKAQKFGGISRYFNEISHIDKAETEIINHLDFPVEATPPTIKRDNILFRGVRFSKRKLGIKNEVNFNPKHPEILTEKLLKGDYDIFHPTYYDPYFLDYVKKPFVLTVYDMIHEIYPEYFGLNDRTTVHKKLLCDKAQSIIAISETTKQDIIDILQVDESKITSILLASNFDQIVPEKPVKSEHLENYILFTGQRWIYKNFYFMLQSISEFLLTDKTLKLVCSGSPFTMEECLFIKNLGIENQVIQYYSKDDHELAWLYQNALCFIFPSLYEGFGFPLLEAFASKCPTISSTGGSLKEIGGSGAYFFNPKDTNELKTALSNVLYNQNVREDLIKNGLVEFDKYNWDYCREKTLKVYSSI